MSDHAKRLREFAACGWHNEAANYIEALEAQNALLRRTVEMLTKEIAAAEVPANG